MSKLLSANVLQKKRFLYLKTVRVKRKYAIKIKPFLDCEIVSLHILHMGRLFFT